MKNNKGFTLVEVIAIISLIAVIVVIIVPIMIKSIDNSKEDAAKISALSFINTIEKFYMSNEESDMNSDYILNGEYNVEGKKITGPNIQDGLELEFTGKAPKNGFLIYENNKIVRGCLTINEYEINLEKDKITNINKGEC